MLVLAGTAVGGAFTKRGTVTRVIDGDTLDARLASGRTTRVRLIGIDAPESGECYGARARGKARELALGSRVVLVGDPTQATRDRYGRLLAYVWLPGGRDLGRRLLVGGFAEVYVFQTAFRRLGVYERAEAAAKSAGRGLWSACAAPPPPSPPAACDPSYPSVCIPSPPPDLDCGEIPYTNFTVGGNDPHGFDGDGDGVGCET